MSRAPSNPEAFSVINLSSSPFAFSATCRRELATVFEREVTTKIHQFQVVFRWINKFSMINQFDAFRKTSASDRKHLASFKFPSCQNRKLPAGAAFWLLRCRWEIPFVLSFLVRFMYHVLCERQTPPERQSSARVTALTSSKNSLRQIK